ncbi:hypothetical protein DD238_000517 [Peronospora effusa]|uniref:Uncharacterized protein n=1 Tax=Peronospora effusa TaxID=542832 RepID=A0A3M6VP57_9STRA|nr:hypothetical protein DD238_000517 [Peronospora effusa]
MQQNMRKISTRKKLDGFCGVLWVQKARPELFLGDVTELQMFVDGDMPDAHKQSEQKLLSRMELAELCRRAEHYVVTMGGGRDQAVVCLAHRGVTLHLDFSSISVKCYPVNVLGAAAEVTFVVANCLKQALRTTTGEMYDSIGCMMLLSVHIDNAKCENR